MTVKPIYIYQGENGTIQTPVKLPIAETKQMRRLIADEGKVLVNGDQKTTCIDVKIEEVALWSEIEEEIEE